MKRGETIINFMDKNISDLRENYTLKSLDLKDLHADPMAQFKIWFDEAVASKLPEPNAMTLSTVVQNKPSSRIVLLKDIQGGSSDRFSERFPANADKNSLENGFIFFSNYDSNKGKAMEENPFVSLTFLWIELERQVRIEGKVQKMPDSYSVPYFHSRPRTSQLGAWVSPQSQIIPNREFLEEEFLRVSARFEDKEIPKPDNWGGYLVVPEMIEFWQGRPSRLHDRLHYTHKNNIWEIERLAP